MGTQSILEINGNRYDALTGKLLGNAEAPKAQDKIRVRTPHSGNGIVDGFSRQKPTRKQPVAVQAKKEVVAPPGQQPAAKTAATKQPAHTAKSNLRKETSPQVHHKLQRSQTLMRSAVSKPSSSPKITKASSIISVTAKSNAHQHAAAKQAMLHGAMDELRLRRASKVIKSETVNKFNHSSPLRTHQSQPAVLSGELVLSPHRQKPEAQAPVLQPLPSMVASATHGHLEQMMDSALKNASSHQAVPLAKVRGLERLSRRSKFAGLTAGLCAVVLLSAFYAYQNVPNVAMRVADSKTGLAATVPSYKPAGFAFNGPIHYGSGVITMSYAQSGNPDRSFSITQRSSSWDSQSLLSDFVSNSNQYQTFQNAGKTIYIYNQQNATWVDQGIWYTIQSKADLNSDQLVNIASSM